MRNDKLLKSLKEIEQRRGVLKPQFVVQEAEDPSHPLHSEFDWDDAVAAEKHRLQQARQLISKVRIQFKENEIDAFYSVRVELANGQQDRAYVSHSVILKNPSLREQILQDALTELMHWEEKYAEYSELKPVMDAAKEVKEEVNL